MSPLFLRAKGDFSTLFGSLEYDPEPACFKPSRPYSNDEWARNNYAREASRYLECLKDAASSDMKYTEQVIQSGYNDTVDEFLEEVRRGY